MHELSYEPPSEGLADGRRLARWLAAGTLVVCGLEGAYDLVQVVLNYGLAFPVASFAEADFSLISGLQAPLAVAVFAVWMVTGRVAVVPLAVVPVAAAAYDGLNLAKVLAVYGFDWSLLAWLSLEIGYLSLGLLFLTPTFRRAVNATPPGRE